MAYDTDYLSYLNASENYSLHDGNHVYITSDGVFGGETNLFDGTISLLQQDQSQTDIYKYLDTRFTNLYNVSLKKVSYAGFVYDCVLAYAHAATNIIHSNPSLAGNVAEIRPLINITTIGNFTGASGEVIFDPASGERLHAMYMVDNFVGNEIITVGQIDGDSTNLSSTYQSFGIPIRFYGNSTIVPLDSIEIMIPYSDPGAVVMVILFMFGLAMTFVSTFMITAHRRNVLVSGLSYPFLMGITLGIFFLWPTILAYIGKMTWLKCQIQQWSLPLGFCIVISNLLVKVYRIFKVFDNTDLSSSYMSNWKLFAMSSTLSLCSIILLIIWSAMDPLKPVRMILPSNDSLYYFVCASSGRSGFGIR